MGAVHSLVSCNLEATHLQNDQLKKILSGDCDNKVDQKRLKQLDLSRNRAAVVTPGLWLPLFGQLESLKLRNTGLSHSQLVELLRLVSEVPPYASLRHLDLRDNCKNNGIPEEQVRSASKGGREVLVETSRKNTQIRRVRRLL